MSKYKTIFFDLDHTLWDYDANAYDTLIDMYSKFELGSLGIQNPEYFVKMFFEINEDLWAKYNVGEIDKFYLRNERFRLVFEAAEGIMKLVSPQLLKEFNRMYLRTCPQKGKLIAGAKEVLDVLHTRYNLHIITNGFEEIQSTKLEASGISKYFDKIITSEKAGFKKPMAGIYTYALKWSKANLDDAIMIGDNLNTDIKGARDYGMDQVYFNPKVEQHDAQVTHEISTLNQLLEIL